ncbi:2-amino-4-hydroxy-6-hydroxymethyldihydropteridine diphosphokinase [Gayadomonas joobiniege]|uniref:2-amino-4-hydroxy-6- hydroxymethyldihydropteridine diphosphokinase n=1 Tax=Gayadomonas joobiniege TaxID=1234606 RepID=UPI0003767C19|nr:2-amino-4-hydroxy-6-hydroxymethyldihydropteridine diphosphokinase [Gayadomonas joobiniege]
MVKVYLGLGSNLAEPLTQLNTAIMALSNLTGVSDLVASSFYASQPLGPQDQPDYVNAVVAFNYQLSAIELLDATQKIEHSQGRVRKKERWGPRTLDIDILLFGNEIIKTDRLTVPHYGMKTREFVIYPLSELAAELILPCGTRLGDLCKQLPKNGLTKL